MPLENAFLLAAGQVPHPDQLVHAAASQQLTVGAECQAVDPSLRPLENGLEISAGHLPHADLAAGRLGFLIEAAMAGGHQFAIRTVGYGKDRIEACLEDRR